MATKNTIKLKKYTDIIEEFTSTAVEVTPGMLLELTSAGTVQAHSLEKGNVAPPMFALEDELQGNGIDVNYAASSKIQVWIPNRGDIVNCLLENGESVVIGDLLVSNGAGLLQKYVVEVDSAADVTSIYPNQVVGQATEAVDMSDSSGADPSGRIAVRIV